MKYPELNPKIPETRRAVRWLPADLARRVSDDTLWYPSHPGHPGCLGWYFRRVERLLGPLYREVGEVWYVEDPILVASKSRVSAIIETTSQWKTLTRQERWASWGRTFGDLNRLSRRLLPG